MIYVVVSNKGGVGKSLLSHNIFSLLVGDNFELIEIDNNNDTSKTFFNSELLRDKTRTVRVKDADDVLDDVFFEAMANQKNVIVDGGGGDDTNRLLEMLAEQPQENIKYIIPTVVGSDDINVLSTYERISNKKNVLFVLNGYHEKENIKDEFMYFFGDDDLEVKGVVGKIKEKIKFIKIPFSNLYKVAQLSYNMTIYDLANLSKDLDPAEAAKIFLAESGGDKLIYRGLYKRYKTSLRAQKLLKEIKDNLAELV
ncbi:MAG: hypothetical protein WC665_05575 [Sulfurimonas sp.]|jgi:hypothetical protein